MNPTDHISDPRPMHFWHLGSLDSKMFSIQQENNIIHDSIYLSIYKAALAQLNAILRLEDANCSFLHDWCFKKIICEVFSAGVSILPQVSLMGLSLRL